MTTGVKTIPAERGQVDTANERDLAIDNHQFLVMAMHRPLMGLKRAPHAGAADQLLAHSAHGRTSQREDRQRRSRPQQHPDLDALSQITEQIAQPTRLIVARQPEIRRDTPPGDMHMRASTAQRLGVAWKRLATVDQHLERAPRARRRIARCPQRLAARRLQLIDPANTPQPATMTPADRDLDALTSPPINPLNQASRHP